MPVYQVITATDPEVGNLAYNEVVELSPAELDGVCAALYSIFGAASPYVRVYLRDGMIRQDYDAIAMSPETLLLQGDEVDLAEPSNWLISLGDLRLSPSKDYTLRIYTVRGKFIFQMSDLKFIERLFGVYQKLGIDYAGSYELFQGDIFVEAVEG